jgi:hypothetical protein
MNAFCILLDSLAAQTGFCAISAMTPCCSAAIKGTKNFDAFPRPSECTSWAQSGGETTTRDIYTQMNQCLPAHSAIAGGISMTRRMVFGRCFENALGPYFRKENRGAVPWQGTGDVPRCLSGVQVGRPGSV